MALIYDKYVEALAVIERLGQGMTLTKAAQLEGIGVHTFNKYVQSDEHLADMFADAVQRGNDALADALLSPDNDALYGRTDPKMAKVVSDNIKWVLSKRDSRFADRVEHKVTLTADTAITTALELARSRVGLPAPEPLLLDVTPARTLSADEQAELSRLLQ